MLFLIVFITRTFPMEGLFCLDEFQIVPGYGGAATAAKQAHSLQ